MSRIPLLLSLCLFSSCYWYPPYEDGYRQTYPPGYWASYPAYNAGGYVPDHGSQIYAPYGQQNFHDATSAPAYGRPTYLTPPTVGEGEEAEGYHEPSYNPPPYHQTQPEYYGGTQTDHAGPPDCDSPTNPMACN